MDIHQAVLEARKEKGWTTAELAQRVGRTRAFVTNIELGAGFDFGSFALSASGRSWS